MSELSHCPNCDEKLKGVLVSNRLLSEGQLAFINEFGSQRYKHLCEKCTKAPLSEALEAYKTLQKELKPIIRDYKLAFPILTLDTVPGWKYRPIEMAYAQKYYRKSADEAVSWCYEKLRTKIFQSGGNALLGSSVRFTLDAHYRAVAVSGTIVQVENLSNHGELYEPLKMNRFEFNQKVARLDNNAESFKKLYQLHSRLS